MTSRNEEMRENTREEVDGEEKTQGSSVERQSPSQSSLIAYLNHQSIARSQQERLRADIENPVNSLLQRAELRRTQANSTMARNTGQDNSIVSQTYTVQLPPNALLGLHNQHSHLGATNSHASHFRILSTEGTRHDQANPFLLESAIQEHLRHSTFFLENLPSSLTEQERLYIARVSSSPNLTEQERLFLHPLVMNSSHLTYSSALDLLMRHSSSHNILQPIANDDRLAEARFQILAENRHLMEYQPLEYQTMLASSRHSEQEEQQEASFQYRDSSENPSASSNESSTPKNVEFAQCVTTMVASQGDKASLKERVQNLPWYDLTAGGDLVCPDIRDHAPNTLYLAMAQMKACKLSQEDKTGKYKNREIGSYGICCRHCGGRPGFARFYPSTFKSFVNGTNADKMVEHVGHSCPACPVQVVQAMQLLEQHESINPTSRRYGSQKRFFSFVWDQMHKSNDREIGSNFTSSGQIESTQSKSTGTKRKGNERPDFSIESAGVYKKKAHDK